MSNAHRFRFQADHRDSGSKDRRRRRQSPLRKDLAVRRLRCERLEDRMLLSGDLKVAFEFFQHTSAPPDPGGTPLSSLVAGGDYWLEAVVQDNRGNNGGTSTGVRRAYFNIGMDTTLVSPDITTYTPGSTFSDGGVTPTLSPGLISNIGATDADLIAPADPGDPFLLFSVECHAKRNGATPLHAHALTSGRHDPHRHRAVLRLGRCRALGIHRFLRSVHAGERWADGGDCGRDAQSTQYRRRRRDGQLQRKRQRRKHQRLQFDAERHGGEPRRSQRNAGHRVAIHPRLIDANGQRRDIRADANGRRLGDYGWLGQCALRPMQATLG